MLRLVSLKKKVVLFHDVGEDKEPRIGLKLGVACVCTLSTC